MKYATHLQHTPPSEPIPGEAMIPNAAGGFVFALDDFQRLRRFLILGCEGGTYYEKERQLTLESVACVTRCLAADGARTVAAIVEVSDRGLAPKNDPAIFALAIAAVKGDLATRRSAFEALPKVCRIGTHLFQFAEAYRALGGGWGRGMRTAVAKWYERDDLVLQALKYQQRNGWSHRDLLRLAHPSPATVHVTRNAVFDAICAPTGGDRLGPGKTSRGAGAGWAGVKHPLVEGYLLAQSAGTAAACAAIVTRYRLHRELIPTPFLNEPDVQAALLPHMPLGALVRNLGNLSKSGLLKPLSDTADLIVTKLGDPAALRASRLHPFSILLAARTYASGHGVKGGGAWTPVPVIIDALDAAFHAAFANVEPTGKRHLLGVDVSSSMGSARGSVVTPAEAAAAMALVTARTEPKHHVMGFAEEFRDLGITAQDTLPTVLAKTRDRNFGGTDTSVAIRWALDHRVEVDAFVIYTDHETWAGDTHTVDALRGYRRATGLPTRLAVVAFTATERSIANSAGDPGSMDFVGMDASLPAALRAFVSEE